MQVKPTRMELLRTKKKLKLAEKGHKLLKEKRDTLVMEFFSTLKEVKEVRAGIGGELGEAEDRLFMAEAHMGIQEIERVAQGLSGETKITFKSKNIMGVKVPEIDELEISPEWYSVISSSTYLEAAVNKYRALAPRILKLAELELKLKRLAEEIKATKRRVNSLEYITIPILEEIKKEVAFKLEERERENFTRLKKIKSKATANA
ncbi:MAG: V-type ATP synthase subunit D [Candidatus Diapherotrites archaeon]|nr:V-type ATP synthase subunit D [Candidatus Diapherotrites archaeon]